MTRKTMDDRVDAPEGTVCCGPLRREPEGSWFHEAEFLGRDDDPQRAVFELDELVGWAAVRLAEALDQACSDLRKAGRETEMRRALLVLRRFHRWQATGRWWARTVVPTGRAGGHAMI